MTASPRHIAFVKEYNRIVDDVMDPDAFCKLFTEDAEFTIGNMPTNVGHDAIGHGCAFMYSMVKSLKHTDDGVYTIDEGSFQYDYFCTD